MLKDLRYYLNLNYEFKLRQLSDEEGSGWFVEIPLLPGCMSDGETVEKAMNNIQDAKKSWIQTSLELNRPIPEPTNDSFSGQLRLRMPKSLYKILSEQAKAESVSLNQFIVYQLSRGIGKDIKK